MKYLYLALFLLVTTPCIGQVTISDRLPPPVKYPAAVYGMTDDQFFQWATEFNAKQEADLAKRPRTEPQYLFGAETVKDHTWDANDDSQVYSGYGSYGPYINYNGGRNYGSSNQRIVTYLRRWPNPFYTGPGPLVIVNPYCKPVK